MRDRTVHASGHYDVEDSDEECKPPAAILVNSNELKSGFAVSSQGDLWSGHCRSLRGVSTGMGDPSPYAASNADRSEAGRANDMLDDKDVDGGWAWVVCFASFLANFILDGVMFSFGIILLELLEYFEDSKSKTAWVGSALLGFSVAVGPVVSLLLEFYSCRQVMILGSLISVFGFILSCFAPNVETLIFTYGVVGGSGFGLSYVSAILVVGLHFNQKRALATGIAMSGSGCGTFAISYLTERLLEWYGWRGTVLILAGVVLHCCVCGALMKPLVKRPTAAFPCCPESPLCCQKQLSALSDQDSSVSRTSNSLPDSQYTDVKQILTPPILKPIDRLVVEEKKHRLFHSNEHVFPLPQNSDRLYKSDFHLHNLLVPPVVVDKRVMADAVRSPISRQDIFYSGSIFNLPEYKKDPNMNSFLKSMTSLQYPDAFQSNLGRSDEYQITSVKEISFVSAHKELFCNSLFLMLLFVMTAWTGHSSVLTYVPDLAVSKGVSSTNAALLVSAVGVSNIIGRLFAGWLTNRQDVDSLVFYTVAICGAGLASAMFPLCPSFPVFVVCCCVFGLCMAACVSLRTVVLADVLGVSKLTKAFGVVAFMQGIAFTVGPPISGALFDSTRSFLPPFLLAAGMYMLSGMTCAFVRPVKSGSCSAPCRHRGSDYEGTRSRDGSESTDDVSFDDI